MKACMVIIFLLTVFISFAQDGKLSEEKRKEFDAQKVAFFTQALDLTPEEAAVFWPLYNEMFKKIRTTDWETRKLIHEAGNTKNVSDKQARELIEKILDKEQQTLQIKKEYYQKMMKAVPVQKISKLDWVEHKFHKQLIEKMRKCPAGPKK